MFLHLSETTGLSISSSDAYNSFLPMDLYHTETNFSSILCICSNWGYINLLQKLKRNFNVDVTRLSAMLTDTIVDERSECIGHRNTKALKLIREEITSRILMQYLRFVSSPFQKILKFVELNWVKWENL
jgi:hypothetical protein